MSDSACTCWGVIVVHLRINRMNEKMPLRQKEVWPDFPASDWGVCQYSFTRGNRAAIVIARAQNVAVAISALHISEIASLRSQ